jgi:hypothetical protein
MSLPYGRQQGDPKRTATPGTDLPLATTVRPFAGILTTTARDPAALAGIIPNENILTATHLSMKNV